GAAGARPEVAPAVRRDRVGEAADAGADGGGPAASELVVEGRPGAPEVQGGLPEVAELHAGHGLHAVALRLPSEVPGPPLREPDLAAAGQAVGGELAELHQAVPAPAVGLGGEAGIVDLEARADPPDPGVERDVAAVLVQAEAPAPAREGRGRGVEVDVGRVGP